MKHLLRSLFVLALAGLLVGAGWWSGRVALELPEDPLGRPEPVTYEVVDGAVGRTLRFTAVAEWPVVDLARNAAFGTVTSVDVSPGDEVSSGDSLYSVDLRPVVLALGSVPAFRDLSLRVEGPDVAQLQALLGELGFFDGEPDGVFGGGTQSAVQLWQTSLGLENDGVVRRGDVIFVPDVPVRVVLTDAVSVGMPLSGGEVTVQRVAGDPAFVIPLVPEQRGVVPLEAEVRVLGGGVVWEGQISEVREDETQGQLLLVLKAPDGNPLWGCDEDRCRILNGNGFRDPF